MKNFFFLIVFLIVLVAGGALYMSSVSVPASAAQIAQEAIATPIITPMDTIAPAPAVDNSVFAALATQDAISKRDHETSINNKQAAQSNENTAALKLTQDVVALTAVPNQNHQIALQNAGKALVLTQEAYAPTLAVDTAKANETVRQMPFIVGTQVLIQLGAGMLLIGLGGFLVYFLRQAWIGSTPANAQATTKAVETKKQTEPYQEPGEDANQLPCPLNQLERTQFVLSFAQHGSLSRDVISEYLPFCEYDNPQARAHAFLIWLDHAGHVYKHPKTGREFTADGMNWMQHQVMNSPHPTN